MTGRRAIIGLTVLCALLVSALAAQGASAVGTTAVECASAGGTGVGFSDAHCKSPVASGAGFKHVPIAETKKVDATNKTTGSETSTSQG